MLPGPTTESISETSEKKLVRKTFFKLTGREAENPDGQIQTEGLEELEWIRPPVTLVVLSIQTSVLLLSRQSQCVVALAFEGNAVLLSVWLSL